MGLHGSPLFLGMEKGANFGSFISIPSLIPIFTPSASWIELDLMKLPPGVKDEGLIGLYVILATAELFLSNYNNVGD